MKDGYCFWKDCCFEDVEGGLVDWGWGGGYVGVVEVYAERRR